MGCVFTITFFYVIYKCVNDVCVCACVINLVCVMTLFYMKFQSQYEKTLKMKQGVQPYFTTSLLKLVLILIQC